MACASAKGRLLNIYFTDPTELLQNSLLQEVTMINKDHYTNAFSDILSLRDLADSTIKNYISYLNQFLDFLEFFLGGILPEEVSWEQLYSSFLPTLLRINFV